jgi:membrane fusion protein, copper/silver efflux system
MKRSAWLLPVLAALVAAGIGGYWMGQSGIVGRAPMSESEQAKTPAPTGEVLYYQDPDGKPEFSAEPKTTPDGRPYRPVFAGDDTSFDSPSKLVNRSASRKILYYRNPMGLSDTSPAPKKDWMGMDYIPVYEGDEQDDGKTVKISLDKLQRSGVRTETVDTRVIVSPVRAVGTAKHDEARLTIVATRSDGYIEDLFVNRTGQHVHAGEPLFQMYSPDIVRAQIDLGVAIRAGPRGATGLGAERTIQGAMQQLRNLGVPESHIRMVRETGTTPRTLDWLSPATGDVIEKNVINGQRVKAGDELFRIADHSHLWVIADVAESDLPLIKRGSRATVTFRAYPTQPVEGEVTFIYPELRMETRTARVRIDVPNPDGRLKIDMYADVVFGADADEAPVIAVPTSAVIDSGTRQIVLVAKGEGRFEPRPVKLGRRNDTHVEIIEGITKGEDVVTAATFLIDAESNLRAALQAFTQPEPSK